MRLLTAKEVAPILRVTPARVYELVRSRAIPAIRLGERQVRFDETALRAWLAGGGSLHVGSNDRHTAAASGGSV